MRRDQPRTALAAVRRVYDKAVAEGNDGQQLRARLTRYSLMGELSPDSATAEIARLEALSAAETRPVVRALWQSALGKLWLHRRADTAAVSRGRACLRASLADVEALGAAKATDYLPLFVRGADSRHYGDDLLSVLTATVLDEGRPEPDERRALLGRVAAYYRARGNRAATLLVTLDSIGNETVYAADLATHPVWQRLQSLAETYADLPLGVETYVAMTERVGLLSSPHPAADSMLLAAARRGLALYGKQARANVLRNYIARRTAPAVESRPLPRVLYPGKAYPLVLRTRNVREAALRFYRLDVAAADPVLWNRGAEEAYKRKKRLAHVEKYAIAGGKEYAFRTDSVRLTAPEAGVYVCETLADGKSVGKEIVYVSRLRVLNLAVGEAHNRVTVVDGESGAPVSGARVEEYARGSALRRAVYEADGEGSIHVRRERGWQWRYFPRTAADGYHPAFGLESLSGADTARVETRTTLHLFTDRAIYRPGQTVRFGGVAYTRRGDDVRTAAGLRTQVRLVDSRGKETGRVECLTDSFGTFSGEFSLPEVCLPGTFGLRGGEGAVSGYVSLRVEAYKRPTFTVETDDPAGAYAPGDTVTVGGTARTYTGLPVAGARVSYRVSRHGFYRASGGYETAGEAVTDSAGRFRVSVVLAADETGASPVPSRAYARYIYKVSFDVTADHGETASASCLLPAATRPSRVEAAWPATLCKERLPRVTVTHANAAGRNVPGRGRYALWLRTDEARRTATAATDTLRIGSGKPWAGGIYTKVLTGGFETGTPFVPDGMRQLPSGEYIATSEVDGVAEADTTALLLFSESDVRPAGRAACWSHVRQSARGDSALVMVGSPLRDVTLFYDLIAQGRAVESRRIVFSDSLLRFALAWRPEYGDGAKAVWAFVKGGQVYTGQAEVARPQPEKELRLRWSTFRSPLTPGRQEEWRLTVTYPDGRPADAVLMATLYDASLDVFAKAGWDYGLYFGRYLPRAGYRGAAEQTTLAAGQLPFKYLRAAAPAFTRWDETLFLWGGRLYFSRVAEHLYGSVSGVRMAANAKVELKSAAVADDAVAEEEAADTADGAVAAPTAGAGGAEEVPQTAVRSHFAETAFFHPALRTDGSGTVTLAFTLPESLTSWNFRALAHTLTMDWGRMDTTAVARKEFMVQAALPRFVREGDRAAIPATVRNLSEKSVAGTLLCTFADARTGRTVRTLREKFSLLPGGAQTFPFTLAVTDGVSVYTVRVTAEGAGFSDGEEHYLPVLPDRVSVTRTLPFSMTERGTRTLRLDTLWTDTGQAADRRLTVELSSNPTWYAVTALPSLADGDSQSATDWAARYYAVALADYMTRQTPALRILAADSAGRTGDGDLAAWADVLKRNPDLKQLLLDETPWVAEAGNEAARTAALRSLFDEQTVAAKRHTALDRLKALQRPDGAWAWFSGMDANRHVTLDVATLLARLQVMAADRTAEDALRRSLAYLEKQVRRDVEEMKTYEREHKREAEISEWHLRYLYIRALLDAKATGRTQADADYLLARLGQSMNGATMYAKSLAAIVLAREGRTQEARDYVKSVAEHTVAKDGMGRWFDTDRAAWSWNAYRIPTQTAAIEAFTECGRLKLCGCPAAGHAADCPLDSAYIGQMRLWLLQSRRTQQWQTSRAATDAVYALLLDRHDASRPLVGGPESTQPLLYTLDKGDRTVDANAGSEMLSPQTAGYFLRQYDRAPDVEADGLTLRKSGDGLAWGAVFAQYTLPTAAVRPAASGLSLTRRLEVARGTDWVAVGARTALRPGDRVRQVMTVTADRDYDFVSLRASRAACMEPAQPLSGYRWIGTAACYRVVRDAAADFFFDRLRKGTHVLTDEYFIDRSGRFECGTATVQCVYAPEFAGTAPGVTVTVE